MPIKIQSDLPVKEILEKENIFVMDEGRAVHQDIRPIRILILNLMPLKEDTELQLLRSLSNTPLQVDVSFMMVATHESKNTATSHLNKFYETFDQVKDHKFDGMIMGRAERDHGVDQDECDLHDLSVLGCPGRSLLSLWPGEKNDGSQSIWSFPPQGGKPKGASCARLR